jgi:hypothetical protein
VNRGGRPAETRMVRLPRRSGLAPASRCDREFQEVATYIVRRPLAQHAVPGWIRALWGLALLSLFLLPSDYRAGGESVHGHSLIHLWADAADGRVEHHHHGGVIPPAHAGRADWLDPRVESDVATGPVPSSQDRPDVPEQHDSAPASSGIHFVLVAMTLLPAVAVVRHLPFGNDRPLIGCCLKIPLPPPRWTPALA